MTEIKLIFKPTVIPIAETHLDWVGLTDMTAWLADYAPDCVPEWSKSKFLEEVKRREEQPGDGPLMNTILPHNDDVSDNELLVEIAGRKCYNSFGKKAGRRSNAAYIANLFGGPGRVPHASVLYHAKMTFFFAGVSRRVSHEMIRNYVGADRDQEGSPSQESTRYTHHPGHFVVHPRDVNSLVEFWDEMLIAYGQYERYLKDAVEAYQEDHRGLEPKGMDRKRIYEAAAMLLPGAAATSFIWTTNPIAAAKFFRERCDSAADLEIQRFAQAWRAVCYERWPNLFPESNPEVDWAQLEE